MLGPPDDGAAAVLRDMVAICTTPVAASRCPCRSRLRVRGRRSATRAATPAGTRTALGKPGNTTFGEDARTRRTSRCGVATVPLTTLLAAKPRPGEEVTGEETRLGAFAARLWLPMLQAPTGRPVMERFDLIGRPAHARHHHGVGSQRGHGKDVRAGRPGHPLPRRGSGHAGRDAADHVQPRRQPRTAGTGARSDRRCGGGLGRAARHPTATSSSICCPARPDAIDARRTRLRDALAGFDAATIATTHEFCSLVLKSLGVAGDTDSGRATGRGSRAIWSPRSSTTSTCAGSASEPEDPRGHTRTALAMAPRRRRQARHRSCGPSDPDDGSRCSGAA